MKKLILLSLSCLSLTAFAGEGVAKSFADMDKNNDGYITKDEAKGKVVTQFAQLDTNADGKLSKDEFSALGK